MDDLTLQPLYRRIIRRCLRPHGRDEHGLGMLDGDVRHESVTVAPNDYLGAWRSGYGYWVFVLAHGPSVVLLREK